MIVLKDLLEFWRSKDPAEAYQYGNRDNCALAQYLRHAYPNTIVSCGGYTYTVAGESYKIPRLLLDVLIPAVWPPTNTFGAVADRLETELALEKTP